MVKNLPANAEDLSDMELSLRWEDCLEEGMAPHSSTLAWRIPWTEEPEAAEHAGMIPLYIPCPQTPNIQLYLSC